MLTSRGTAESIVLTPPRVARRRRPDSQAVAALLSALISMGAYCLAMAVHGTYPFGSRSRAVNDLGNQFVPLHAHLWDLMHGQATGDLFFNWNSGYGVPFLADFFTYLTNPFSWLVVFFPRGDVQAPVFLVTLLSIGLGAALMTVFLGRLRPGSPWLRALLSVGFAVSAWAVSDGAADPMWMWVLVSLPVLGIVSDWCLQQRRWVPGVLLVALCVVGNFYTAAMAIMSMGLILLVRLLLDERPVRERGRILLRAVTVTGTGVLLAAPMLTVTYKASKASQPPVASTYGGAPDILTYLAHLLPGGPNPTAPRVGVGILPLVLVAVFPFMRRVPAKERALWLGLIVLVALSYIWKPTILLWHGLAMPNGSPYRAAVAMTPMLVSVAWLALARKPRPGELLAGAGLLALLFLLVSRNAYISGGDWVVILIDTVVVFGLLLVYLHKAAGRRAVRTGVVVALACSVFASTTYGVYSVTVRRDQDSWWAPKRTVDSQTLAAHDAVRAQDNWPATRTDPGPNEFADNDPLLIGGQGGSYYSSYVPAKTAQALAGLGAAWYMQGRHVLSFFDPVGRAIMGVSTYLTATPHNVSGFAQVRVSAPPLVTLRPGTALDKAGGTADTSVFAAQERVLGSKVYTVPTLIPTSGPTPTLGSDGSWHLPGHTPGTAWTTFTATCRPGDSAYAYMPWYSGMVRADGQTFQRIGVFRTTDTGILPIGAVPAGGKVTMALGTVRGQNIPRFPIGCLDQHALTRAVAKLKATGPAAVTAGGHSIAATFRQRTTGTAVVAVPAVDGWTCSVDGAASKAPGTLGGLIAVNLGSGGSRVACSFQTPGLSTGLLASGAALAIVLAVAAGGLIRTRRLRDATRELP